MPDQLVQSDTVTAACEVLVVDDSPHDVRLMRDGFVQWQRSPRITVASNGAEALQILRGDSEHARPELILLDWNLPGLKGEEVLERLKADQELRSIPVVVFTSSSAPSDRRRAADLGANRFITKPFDVDDYFKVIAGLESFAHGHYSP